MQDADFALLDQFHAVVRAIRGQMHGQHSAAAIACLGDAGGLSRGDLRRPLGRRGEFSRWRSGPIVIRWQRQTQIGQGKTGYQPSRQNDGQFLVPVHAALGMRVMEACRRLVAAVLRCGSIMKIIVAMMPGMAVLVVVRMDRMALDDGVRYRIGGVPGFGCLASQFCTHQGTTDCRQILASTFAELVADQAANDCAGDGAAKLCIRVMRMVCRHLPAMLAGGAGADMAAVIPILQRRAVILIGPIARTVMPAVRLGRADGGGAG